MRPQARRIRRPHPRRHHIGHQPLAAGPILARDHRRLRHAGMPQQRRLDLARLDPEPAQLHLRVRAPQELQHPVGRQRARSPVRYIRPPPQRQTGPPQTAPPSDPHGPDSRAPAQPPRCKARPQRPQAQAPDRRPGHKPACSRSDGRSAERQRRPALAHGRADRCLGRTVGVDHPPARRPARHQSGGAGFAGDDQGLEAAGPRASSASSTGGKVAWVTLLLADQARQSVATALRLPAARAAAPDINAVAISETAASKLGEAN